MSLSYKVTITDRLTETDYEYDNQTKNIQSIEVTNSKDRMYQTGKVFFHNFPTRFVVGDYVQIDINGEQVFYGYISSIEITGGGTRKALVKLIGKTYDLWKIKVRDRPAFEGEKK